MAYVALSRRSDMNFEEFTGQVQNRLELPGTGEAVRAVRATLTTLGERIQRRRPRTSRDPCRWRSAST